MVQIAVRSTANPNTIDWIPMWDKAEAVWSYYDLKQLMADDGCELAMNFYYAPLGVDSKTFDEFEGPRDLTIVVGDSRDESVNECIRAAYGNVGHLGTGVDDATLALTYSRSEFVSGLRRTEGFEMPVLEGLLCGARPVCYDKPHYRHWFKDLAEFIPEGHPEEVVESLRALFKAGPRVVTPEEKESVRFYFNWEHIVKGFWERVL